MNKNDKTKIKLKDDIELLEKKGGGGAGVVWKARLTRELDFGKANKIVAVKIYKDKILKEHKEKERIKREFSTGSKLVHPNLVKMYHVDVDCPEPFLVMEWCGEDNLEEWRKKNPEPEEDFLLNFVTQIFEALDFLHASKRFHRDIKPKNIQIDSDGRIRLMDYGVIKPLRDIDITEKNGKFLGTYRYAPPEFILKGDYNYASDLYSFGGALYFLLHGFDIFRSEKSNEEIIEAKKRHKINFHEHLRKKSPTWTALFDLCEKLLVFDPDDRPQSVIECLDFLSQFLPKLFPFRTYFAAALTRMSEKGMNKMERIAKIVKHEGDNTGYAVYLPKQYTDPDEVPELTSREVYWIDRERVASSDLLIVYGDEPSIGVGQEVEIATNAGVPIVLLYSKGARISRMLLGTAGRIVGKIEITKESEVGTQMNDFFKKNSSRILFNRKSREFEYQIRLGKRVRSIRDEMGFSIKELASSSDVDSEQIENLETRPEKLSTISIINLRRLSKTLNVTPAELLKDQSEEEQKLEEIWNSNLRLIRRFSLKKGLSYYLYSQLKSFGREKFQLGVERLASRGDKKAIAFNYDTLGELLIEVLSSDHTPIKLPVSDD